MTTETDSPTPLPPLPVRRRSALQAARRSSIADAAAGGAGRLPVALYACTGGGTDHADNTDGVDDANGADDAGRTHGAGSTDEALRAAGEFVTAMGWEVVGEFTDPCPKSPLADRLRWRQVLALAGRHRIRGVVSPWPEALAADPDERARAVGRLDDHGVFVQFTHCTGPGRSARAVGQVP
ncbi:recombinase family protein [Streptomyces sp. NPDC059506]|uniref:recombinase family protein n=1 Tax=Streptomyces sp. NPDC059506 TaxID=3347751 RepID=UPI003676828E